MVTAKLMRSCRKWTIRSSSTPQILRRLLQALCLRVTISLIGLGLNINDGFFQGGVGERPRGWVLLRNVLVANVEIFYIQEVHSVGANSEADSVGMIYVGKCLFFE